MSYLRRYERNGPHVSRNMRIKSAFSALNRGDLSRDELKSLLHQAVLNTGAKEECSMLPTPQAQNGQEKFNSD